MVWPQRGSGVCLGGSEIRSDARRYALIAVCALIACASGYPRFANADPSASGYASHAGYSGEQRAEEMYLDGIEKLQAGHRDFARDTFEQLVARYPSSAAAGDARRQLGELYHHDHSQVDANAGDAYGDARPALAVAPPETTGSISAPAISDMNVLPDVQPARGKGWDQELRRNASIQSKLRIEAGDRVFFSPGSAELGSRARNALAAQAKWLMRWHEFEAAIEGHADEPGTEQENVILSEQRAEAVRERLIQEGIQPSRLAVVPLGRSIPVATCADTDCRAQNRRAVTLVFATGTRDRLGLVVSGSSRAASAALVPSATAVQAVEGPGGVQSAGVTR